MKEIKGEAKFTFLEATSIIVGHGVGSGILAVPFLAGRNSWRDIIIVVVICYLINLLMHLMIAELSYNNGGLQFIKCIEAELFKGKVKKIVTWTAFAFLGLSVISNVVGFITGGGAVLQTWLNIPPIVAMLIYYAVTAFVVLF